MLSVSAGWSKKIAGFIKERDILRKAVKYFAQRDKLVIRFRFACDHRTVYSVKRMCQVLKINRSSFYKWCATNPRREEKTREDKKLGARIKAVFDKEKGLYGAKRITVELNSQQNMTSVNHKRVARIMKLLGLYGFSYKPKGHHHS